MTCQERTSAWSRRNMAKAPEDGTEANTEVMHQPLDKPGLKRNLRPLVGSPCPCSYSTTPSWPRTNLPSSSRSHPGNCRDLLGVAVPLADHRYDGCCSTRSAWLGPKSGSFLLRN